MRQSGAAHGSSEVRTRQDPHNLMVIRSLVGAGHGCGRRDIKASCKGVNGKCGNICQRIEH